MSASDPAGVQERHRESLERLFAGEALGFVPALRRIDQNPFLAATDQAFDEWLASTLHALEEHAEWFGHAVTFHPMVVEFWPLGVHFVDALFGARVRGIAGQFWTDCLPGGLADIEPVRVDDAPLVRWALRATRRALMRLPESVALSTPVFASPLNVAVNLLGERALTDLAAPGPGEGRGLTTIGHAIRDLHDLWRLSLPPDRVRHYASSFRYTPDGCGHLCGCTTQLIGPEAYARHIAPLDEEILGSYPGGGTIHLCGHHTQHIPCWREMRPLRGLEITDAAADDFPAYSEGLREDQIIYVGPTPRMTVEGILRTSAGRRTVLQGLREG